MAFSTLINYFRKLFEIFRGYFQACFSAETTTGRCSLKETDKNDKNVVKSGKLIMRKISKSFCEVHY